MRYVMIEFQSNIIEFDRLHTLYYSICNDRTFPSLEIEQKYVVQCFFVYTSRYMATRKKKLSTQKLLKNKKNLQIFILY